MWDSFKKGGRSVKTCLESHIHAEVSSASSLVFFFGHGIWLSHLMGTFGTWFPSWQHWDGFLLNAPLDHCPVGFKSVFNHRNGNGIMIQWSPLTNDVSYVECFMFFKNQPALRFLRDLLSSDLGFSRWGTNPSQTAGHLASFSPSICASKTGVCTSVRWEMLGKGLGNSWEESETQGA